MRYILPIILAFIAIACSKLSEPEKVSRLLTGEWKIADYEWESRSALSDAERKAFQDAANLQKRRFLAFSNFEFNEDKTYRLDFTGNGGDIGTWQISNDIKLVHYSDRYETYDTVAINYFSKDTFKLLIEDNFQSAQLTIVRKD